MTNVNWPWLWKGCERAGTGLIDELLGAGRPARVCAVCGQSRCRCSGLKRIRHYGMLASSYKTVKLDAPPRHCRCPRVTQKPSSPRKTLWHGWPRWMSCSVRVASWDGCASPRCCRSDGHCLNQAAQFGRREIWAKQQGSEGHCKVFGAVARAASAVHAQLLKHARNPTGQRPSPGLHLRVCVLRAFECGHNQSESVSSGLQTPLVPSTNFFTARSRRL